MKKALKVIGLASVLAISSQAYMYEITPTVGGVIPEGNLDLDDALSYGLRLGVNVDNYIFDQVEAGIEHAPSVDIENTTFDTDVTRFFVNLVKEYEVAPKTTLYGLVGLGYEHFSKELADNDSDGFGNYGVGIKYAITEALNLKADVRHAISFEGNNNLLYSVGLSFPFGGEAPRQALSSVPVEPKTKTSTYVEPTPAPAPLPAPDFDRDGVADGYDKCPDTPAGVKVDTYGCAQTITLRVMFDFDKATIKPEYMEKIEEVAGFLKTHKQYDVKLEGHTDSKGSDAYNKRLSNERATAVAKALESLGVEKRRMSAKGFGEEQPIATNESDEGRALNRRVEAKFSK